MALRSRNGVWQFVKSINGTLYRRSTRFPVADKKTKAAAARRASEIETEIRSGVHGWTKDVPTVTAYWTKTYRPTYTLRKGAPERDDQVMAHALPVFGPMQLDEVKKSDCERYLNKRRLAPHANPGRRHPGRMAEGSVQRERSFLHAFFQQAVEDGVIDKNPWRKIERIAYAVRDRLLSHEEQPVLLGRLSPRFQRFVLFLLGTGIRLDECRGINPAKDLHLVERWVRVTGKGGKVRDVPIPAVLVPVLEAQLAEPQWDPKTKSMVTGGLWRQNPQRLRAVLAKACRERRNRAGAIVQTAMPHLSPHVFRHTFGWRWLQGGGDIYTLSKVLGHATVAVTEKHYAHLLKGDIMAKADKVDLGLGLPIPGQSAKVLAWKA